MKQTNLNKERIKIYNDLGELVGNTDLELYQGETPNNNQIWIKKEFDNPFGSHYDRVYLSLFRHYEEQGKIKPGDKVLETTSGSAGVSFAGIGKILGYDCHVAIPAGGEKAREKAILEQLPDKDHLIFTDEERYISGFPDFVKEFLEENPDIVFLNHSMGAFDKNSESYSNNNITLGAMEQIYLEIPSEPQINYFMPAVGNGTTVLGIGKHFRSNKTYTNIIPFEHVKSGVLYDKVFPGVYEKLFNIKPGTLPRHNLPGTSFNGIDFPHIINSLDLNLNGVILVSDKETDDEYEEETGKTIMSKLPHWDINTSQYPEFGRTTNAGIAVALEASKLVKCNNILIIGYDKIDRYDN